jgi:hypothetical protein
MDQITSGLNTFAAKALRNLRAERACRLTVVTQRDVLRVA